MNVDCVFPPSCVICIREYCALKEIKQRMNPTEKYNRTVLTASYGKTWNTENITLMLSNVQKKKWQAATVEE